MTTGHTIPSERTGAGVGLFVGLIWALLGLALLDTGPVYAGAIMLMLGAALAAYCVPAWIRTMDRAASEADEHS